LSDWTAEKDRWRNPPLKMHDDVGSEKHIPGSVGTAARIRSLRVRAGRSQAATAEALGLNGAWYDDLEHRDGELERTLTLFQVSQLASLFGVTVPDLFGCSPPGQRVELIDVPSRIETHVAHHHLRLEDFERVVGWELSDFMRSPVQTAAESPVGFLQAIARSLDIEWLSLVPE
jgi:transcriptional regulator with XRE-family HTH domain